MKSMVVASLLAAGLIAAGPAIGSEQLAKKAGCVMCHATAEKKVGASWKDIAASHKGKAGADAQLFAKLKAGKEHPPVKGSDGDLKAILKWALAM